MTWDQLLAQIQAMPAAERAKPVLFLESVAVDKPGLWSVDIRQADEEIAGWFDRGSLAAGTFFLTDMDDHDF